MHEVPFGINTKEDFDVCFNLKVKVYVFNRNNLNGESKYSGFLTGMDDDFIYVDSTPFGRDKFVVLTQDH